jgi:thiol-disulfide isomerase/thioredoxin
MAMMILVLLACAGSARAAEEMCVVCALNGETEPEKVVASRTFEGRDVRFCSEKCAAEFDSDPRAYVFVSGPAPDLVFVSLQGDTIATSRLRGKIVLVDFWATSCKPCVKSMPDLDALQRASGGEVVVVGVSVDQGDDREKKVRKFLEKHRVGYPIVVDAEEDSAWERLRVRVLPTLFLIAPDGTIVSRHAGPLRLDELKGEIAALSAGRAD